MSVSDDTGLNGTHYRCIVAGSCPPAVTSNAALLTVQSLSTITVQPVQVTVCGGSIAAFSVAATGGSPTYQWQSDSSGTFENVVNNTIYSGTTNATINISNTTGLNGINYQCVVTSCGNSITSNPASLTVNSVPAIVIQPEAETVCSDNSTYFSVTVTGANLSYQWQRLRGATYVNITNTAVYSGINADTLKIISVAGLNNMQYRCLISGTCAPVATTNSVTLNVNPAPAITIQPVTALACTGSGTSFSVTATGGLLNYQWQIMFQEVIQI